MQRIRCSVVRRGKNGLQDFKLPRQRKKETDKTPRCYVLYETGSWMVAGLMVESEVRGMVRWGERSDERCEDECARQPVVRTPGNPHFGTGPASVKILFPSIQAAKGL